jgi:hypothetical protein
LCRNIRSSADGPGGLIPFLQPGSIVNYFEQVAGFASLFKLKDIDNEDKMSKQDLLPDEIRIDLLLNSIKVLNLIDSSQADTLAIFDEIQEKGERENINWYDAAREIGFDKITAPVLALSLYQILYAWIQDDRRVLITLSFIPYFLDDMQLDANRFEDQVVIHIIRALEPIASLQLSKDFGIEDLLQESVPAFVALTDLLTNNRFYQEAFGIINSVCNIVAVLNSPELLKGLEKAANIAFLLGDKDLIGLATARLAVKIAQSANDDTRTFVEAFDAIEKALMHLPVDSAKRKQALGWLFNYLEEEKYESLVPYFYLGMPKDQKINLSEDLLQAEIWLDRVSGKEQEAWLKALWETVSLVIEVENGRLALQPSRSYQYAEADWATWSFTHDVFRSAIPDGKSLFREENLNQILLDLNHEITHVFSMLGEIGLSIMALRLAALEVEMNLWTFISPAGGIDFEKLIKQGVAPLDSVNWLALPQAEQALEISRKNQILQEIWQPWFEGVAIYVQLAADPLANTKAYSPSISIITHLFDAYPSKEIIEKGEIGKWVAEQFKNPETLYSEILAGDDAYYCLRTFLVKYPDHYLAGYLIVRCIVSAWRDTLGHPINGAEVALILLHLTRFSSGDTIPNLGLPLSAFRSAVSDRMLEWFDSLINISRLDLETIIDTGFSQSLDWEKGKLVKYDEEQGISVLKLLADRMKEAYSSLCGENADLNRIPDAGPDCIAFLRESAGALARTRSTFAEHNPILRRYIDNISIFPIGQVEAPFWLNRKSCTMFCLIRTTESAKDSKKPGYNGFIFPLSQEDFAKLENLIATQGLSRITVTRIADAVMNYSIKGRIGGRHYVVLQCGDWINVRSRGLYMEAEVPPSVLEDVESYFLANPFRTLDANIIARGLKGAQRTTGWLQRLEPFEERAYIEPWINYLINLAEEILNSDKRTERVDMSARILKYILSNESFASHIQLNGLRAISGDDPEILKQLVRFLNESARLPVSEIDTEMARLASDLLIHTPFGWDITLPKARLKQQPM